MKALQNFTDEQLLLELVTRNTLNKGPIKTVYYGDDWLDCIIGIGSDNVANIRLSQEDFDALTLLAKEKNTELLS